ARGSRPSLVAIVLSSSTVVVEGATIRRCRFKVLRARFVSRMGPRTFLISSRLGGAAVFILFVGLGLGVALRLVIRTSTAGVDDVKPMLGRGRYHREARRAAAQMKPQACMADVARANWDGQMPPGNIRRACRGPRRPHLPGLRRREPQGTARPSAE